MDRVAFCRRDRCCVGFTGRPLRSDRCLQRGMVMAELSDNAREIMEVLRAAQGSLRARFLKLLLPHKLTMPRHKALQHIHWHSKQGGLTIGELSEHLGLACSTVSGIVDRLQRDGWVRRNRPTSDRRIVKVELTSKAERLFSQRTIDTENFWLTTIGRLTEAEQAALVHSLRRLREVMEEPDWPSYEEIHAAGARSSNAQEDVQRTLEQIWSEEIRSVGIRFVLARVMDEDGNSEIAAYLRQAAHEEARHALTLGRLLGKIGDVKQSLLNLVEAEQKAWQRKFDATELDLKEEVIRFLDRAAEDERQHKQWFKKLAAKCS